MQAYHEVFVKHVFADIAFCFESKRWLAGGQLLMAAIDILSGLERRADKEESDRHDFIAWANRYLCLAGPEYTLTGTDIYAARCGLLHSYSTSTKLVRQGKAVTLGWLDFCNPPVRASEDGQLVLASLAALFKAVLAGTADSMERINRDEALARLVNARMAHMFRAETLDERTAATLSYAGAEPSSGHQFNHPNATE